LTWRRPKIRYRWMALEKHKVPAKYPHQGHVQ
jgi:hypothetical protein